MLNDNDIISHEESKKMYTHLFNQMEKLAAKKITIDEAKATAALAKQANNVRVFELDKEKFLFKVTPRNTNVQH